MVQGAASGFTGNSARVGFFSGDCGGGVGVLNQGPIKECPDQPADKVSTGDRSSGIGLIDELAIGGDETAREFFPGNVSVEGGLDDFSVIFGDQAASNNASYAAPDMTICDISVVFVDQSGTRKSADKTISKGQVF